MSTSSTPAPFYMIDQAILTEYNLNPYEIALYNVIASHINHEIGRAWPSYSRLMVLGHMARATVSKNLKLLEAKGLIEIIRSYKPNSKERAVNHYRLLNPHRQAQEGGSSRESRGSSPGEPEVVHAMDEGSSPDEPEVVHAANRNYTNPEQKIQTRSDLNQREGTAHAPQSPPATDTPVRGNSSPSKEKTLSSMPRAEWDLFCHQLADVCQLDFEANKSDIRRTARKLWRKGQGYTVEDLQTFGAWWYMSDWRGKKGDVPRLKEVIREIRKAVEAQEAQVRDRYRYIMGEFAEMIEH